MVLRASALAVFAIGCGQSLFDNNVGGTTTDGGGSGSGDGGMVASSCPAGCIGDAAADIDGSRPGWKYVEDRRNRTWADMTASGGGFVGAVAGNEITTCAAKPTAAACTALPGALLVSTAGATTAADPAIVFTAASQQVIQLSVRVHVPAGQPEQQVRVYRNSREDVLFTAPATAGTTFERAVTVDALAGDRFLLAIAPQAMGATDVGVHLYVNTTGEVFPKQCQLAVSFSSATGNTVGNACGAVVTGKDYNTGDVAPVLGAGPFAEQGMAADVTFDRYYEAADVIPRTGDTTTQLWIRHDGFMSPYSAFAFSDVDLNNTGGLQIGLFEGVGGVRMLEAATCTVATMTTLDFAYADVPYPNDTNWHFVRVVHTNGQVRVCIDGTRVGSFVAPAGSLASTFHPYLGRNVVWTPSGAFFDGGLDDVRSFSTALPCE